jgi:hypothetical protein
MREEVSRKCEKYSSRLLSVKNPLSAMISEAKERSNLLAQATDWEVFS